MEVTDPISDVERRLARAIVATARAVTGHTPDDVQAHVRDGTVVLLVECAAIAEDDPEVSAEMGRGIVSAVERELGRVVPSPRSRTRVSDRSALTVLRLAGRPSTRADRVSGSP